MRALSLSFELSLTMALAVPCSRTVLHRRATRLARPIAVAMAAPSARAVETLLPSLVVRNAHPAEVKEIAALLSTVFYPAESAASASRDGARDLHIAPPLWQRLQEELRRLSTEVGKFVIEASLAQRLSTEAFAQGFNGRAPAASMLPDAESDAPSRKSSFDNAYALLVVEVLPHAADAGREGPSGRERAVPLEPEADGARAASDAPLVLAAAVELGIEEMPAPAARADIASLLSSEGVRRAPYLASLAVAPEHRGRGAARQLLMRAETLALAWGYHEIVLDAATANRAAVELYTSCGYRLEGRTPLLDLPVAMLLNGDRGSGRWRKQLGRRAEGAADARATSEDLRSAPRAGSSVGAAERSSVGQGSRGAKAELQPGLERAGLDDRLGLWAEWLGARAWRGRWGGAQLLATFALSAALSPPAGQHPRPVVPAAEAGPSADAQRVRSGSVAPWCSDGSVRRAGEAGSDAECSKLNVNALWGRPS